MVRNSAKRGFNRLVIRWLSVKPLNSRDVAALASRFDHCRLTYYDIRKLKALAKGAQPAVSALLRQKADGALKSPVRSVTDKPAAVKNGSRNDYWSAAPYWWPNPETNDGMPYVKRDGERIIGATLFAPGSENHDRTRLYEMVRDVTILALAWQAFDQRHYAECAAKHLRAWFLDPFKRMTPNLEFAQVRGGHSGGRGNVTGIVEAKDFYFFMDALRLVESAHVLSSEEIDGLKRWFRSYLFWLTASKSGRRASLSVNNLGTMYDLQCAAIACYVGETNELYRALRRARARIGVQFGPHGEQPLELSRATPWHYCTFNLTGWTALARLAGSVGDGVWRRGFCGGRFLQQAIEWLVSNAPRDGVSAFNQEDLRPLREDGCADPATLTFGTVRNPSIDTGYGPFTELTLALFDADSF